LARGSESQGKNCAQGAFFCVTAHDVLKTSDVLEEVFGPSSVLIRCQGESELASVLEHLEGQLTATVHMTYVIGAYYGERALLHQGVEHLARVQHGLHVDQHLAYRLEQCTATRSQLEIATDPSQQLIAKVFSQL
jgi:hypothetical protein